jgi:hypothetical protein
VAYVQAACGAHAAYYALFSDLVPGRQTLFLSSVLKHGALRIVGAATAAGTGKSACATSRRPPSRLRVNGRRPLQRHDQSSDKHSPV